MSEFQNYIPSEEELQLAEDSMTPEQKKMSDVREKEYREAEKAATIAQAMGEDMTAGAILDAKEQKRMEKEEATKEEVLKEIRDARTYHSSWANRDFSVPYQIREIFEEGKHREVACKDRDIVLAGMRRAGGAASLIIRMIDPSLRNDREIVFEAVSQDPDALSEVAPEFRKDMEVALLAVRHKGEAIRYVDKSISGEREVVLSALNARKPFPNAAEYCSKELLADRDFVMSIIDISDDFFYRKLPEELRGDPEIIEIAVKRELSNLKSVPEKMRTKEVVLAAFRAINENGYDTAIYDADESVPADLWRYKDFVLDLGSVMKEKKHSASLYSDNISQELWKDKEFVVRYIELTDGYNFSWSEYNKKDIIIDKLSPELQKDEKIILAAIKADGRNLRIGTEEMKADQEIVRAASLQSRGEGFKYASAELKTDKDFILTLFGSGCEQVYKEIDEGLKTDKEIVLAAINCDYVGTSCSAPWFLKQIPASMFDDIEIVAATIKHYGSSLRYISSDDEKRVPKQVRDFAKAYYKQKDEMQGRGY